MIEVFNAITNIANSIEKDVFTNYDNFTTNNKTAHQIQKDVSNYCEDLIEKEFSCVKSIKGIISKEGKKLCDIHPDSGKYLISYVPIDNMELLDLNFSLGTIFGIYEESFSGKKLKAVTYITYGPTFQLVFASQDEGVKYFSHEHGEFIQKDSLVLNEKGKINSTAGIKSEFTQQHTDLLESFFEQGYRLRFSNSLVLDTHQILFKKGGLYSSPKTLSYPDGMLDLLFEAYPIAFIIELAGGEAIDGEKKILDIEYSDMQQKTPIYFGSKSEITKVKETLS